MLKGLGIMLVVFLVIAVLGWLLSRIGNASEEGKRRIRKILFALYGLFLIFQGSLTIWDYQQFRWLAGLQIVLGGVFIWAAVYGKFDPPPETTS